MKIAAVIYNLSAGGAERALVNLVSAWNAQGHKITVITLDTTQSDFYTLTEEVNHIALAVAGQSHTIRQALGSNLGRIRKLRQAIVSVKPDVVVSFMDRTNVLLLIVCKPLGIPVIVIEQMPPAYASSRIWSILRRMIYPQATALVSASKGIDAYFKWLSVDKRYVIYNPLNTAGMDEPPALTLNTDRKYLMGMGRLSYEKGFDILIEVFAQLARQYPDWDLVILGEGTERPKLAGLIHRCGLNRRVLLPGNIKNPLPILKQCHIFVLPSRFEGFGNVLTEAMVCGLPVVSFDCPSGPAEIIQNGISGILVPHQDINGLKQTLDELMSDESKRQQLAGQAVESVKRFLIDEVAREWNKLITKVIS